MTTSTVNQVMTPITNTTTNVMENNQVNMSANTVNTDVAMNNSNEKKPKKKKSIFKIVGTIIKVVFVCYVVFFGSFIILQRFSNNSFSVFGYRLFSVATGSMEPMYNIGDVLLCKEVDVKTLVVGDDVTYIGNSGAFNNRVVTHRIIRIDKDEDGKLRFHTKGLAAVSEDPAIGEDQIYGKIQKNMVWLSAFHKFISKPIGFFICIVIPLLVLIGSEIIQSMLESYEEKLNKQKM